MPSAATTHPKITLGALYRCLLDRLDTSLGLRVGIHFEERTSIVVEPAVPGTEPTRIEQRTFDADVAVSDRHVMRATLTAGATAAESLVIRVAQSEGVSRYSIAGAGFGDLRVTPEIFDLVAFGERLDGVQVDDAVIAPETPDGSGRIVIDAEIDGDSFGRLLRAFGGGEPGNLELPLLSHSAVLSAGSDVTLDYWWSLLGLDEVDGRPARHNVVICHVHASFAPLTSVDELGDPMVADPELPVLEDIDAAWELARQRRAGL